MFVHRKTLLILHFLCFSNSEVFAEAISSGDHTKCSSELQEVPLSSLWPRNTTLRSLASLLTAEDPQVNKAAADYLSSAEPHSFFRARVSCVRHRVVVVQTCHEPSFTFLCNCQQAVECYTQALSEAGVQSQRAACSALGCLQVSGLSAPVTPNTLICL